MSIFFGRLSRYYKKQTPINFIAYKGTKFEDPEFNSKNMFFSKDETKNVNYINNLKSMGFFEKYNVKDEEEFKKNVVYVRISDFIPNLNIFNKDINCTKFKQGYLNNCYFLDVVALLSNYGQLLTQIFRIDKANSLGYYEICFLSRVIGI